MKRLFTLLHIIWDEVFNKVACSLYKLLCLLKFHNILSYLFVVAGKVFETLYIIWVFYKIVFCILLLISTFFEILRVIYVIAIHATGQVKVSGMTTGISLLLNPFIIFILFKMNLSIFRKYIIIL